MMQRATMRLVTVLLMMCVAAPARADMEAAKVRHKKGTSYFALGKYAEAAAEYEAAFELEPDAAFLFNAAQAHRLAGHRVRALTLYQSFARLYPDNPNAADAQRQVAALKATVEADRARGNDGDGHPLVAKSAAKASGGEGATAAGATTTSARGATSAATPAAAPTPTTTADNALTQTAPPPAKRRTPRWVWGVVAGAAVVAAGLGVGLGVGLSGDRYPTPTAGSAHLP